jgi:hypothetical protein
MATLLQSNEAAPETTLNTLIGGYVDVDVAGSADVTPSDAEAQNAHIELSGTLTDNINVIFPTELRGWRVYNNTSGSYTVTVKTSAGTGVTVTQGNKAYLICDGTNIADWST